MKLRNFGNKKAIYQSRDIETNKVKIFPKNEAIVYLKKRSSFETRDGLWKDKRNVDR